MDDELTLRGGELLAGKYLVEKTIGQGGMGVVLAAEHIHLNQKVAIKLLRTNAMKHTDVVGRFMREARAVVRLRSEHVARVIDVGTLDDKRPFIVMERLEGFDLDDVINKGPTITVGQAVDYVLQACEAVAEAHAAGIVHRDLKPKNLFLTHAIHGKPIVKVLDFGISKIDPAHAPNEMQLTGTAEVIGSPSYMSPEQLRSSKDVDARTDIWALGCILYELLTKRVPFLAETVTKLVLIVVGEREDPIETLRPDVPPGLAQVIHRCLEKDPAQRFQSVVELVQALEPYANLTVTTAVDRVRAVANNSSPPVVTPRSGTAVLHPSSSQSTLSNAATAAMSISGRPLMSAPPSSGAVNAASVPVPAPSSRVNGNGGGTSVAWGETHSQVSTSHALPMKSPTRTGFLIGVAMTGMLFALGVGAGILYFVLRPTPAAITNTSNSASAPPVLAAGEGSVPLPPGRKDLPPSTAAPSTSGPPTAEPPAASSLPAERKPPTPKAAPAPKAPAKADDLSNIGRR